MVVNRCLWILGVFQLGGLWYFFLKGFFDCLQFFFCVYKCYLMAVRLLKLYNKVERVFVWGVGFWVVCQGCQVVQILILIELRDKKIVSVKVWKFAREMICFVRRQCLVCLGFFDTRLVFIGWVLMVLVVCKVRFGCVVFLVVNEFGLSFFLWSFGKSFVKLLQFLVNIFQKGEKTLVLNISGIFGEF